MVTDVLVVTKPGGGAGVEEAVLREIIRKLQLIKRKAEPSKFQLTEREISNWKRATQSKNSQFQSTKEEKKVGSPESPEKTIAHGAELSVPRRWVVLVAALAEERRGGARGRPGALSGARLRPRAGAGAGGRAVLPLRLGRRRARRVIRLQREAKVQPRQKLSRPCRRRARGRLTFSPLKEEDDLSLSCDDRRVVRCFKRRGFSGRLLAVLTMRGLLMGRRVLALLPGILPPAASFLSLRFLPLGSSRVAAVCPSPFFEESGFEWASSLRGFGLVAGARRGSALQKHSP